MNPLRVVLLIFRRDQPMKNQRRKFLSVVLITFALSLAGAMAQAQSATASLSGAVTDPQNAAIAGATIKAVNTATNLERRTTTNSEGYFTLPLLPPGNYRLSVEQPGFATIENRSVTLNVGDQRTLSIQLRISGVSAAVNVTDDASLMNESPAVGTVVNQQFIKNQPLNGRSFLPLVELSPGTVLTATVEGVQGDFSVNGQRPGTNYFTIDGVSANFGIAASGALTKAGGSYPAYSAQGVTSSLASVDAVQEFVIQTSTYAPEFGRQPGAQVSIVTRSGANGFHGGVFNFLRNDVLDANDYFANVNGLSKPALRQNDFGFTLGGPLYLPRFGDGGRAVYSGRDRTFFFVSYEGLRLRQPAISNPQTVPSLAARQLAAGLARDILNAYPLPTGAALADDPLTAPFIGGYSNPSSLDATSARVDHTVSKTLTLFGRYNIAPSKLQQRSPFGVGTVNTILRTKAETRTFTTGATAVVSPRVTNDFRFNYSRSTTGSEYSIDDFGGATPPPDAALFPPQLATRETAGGALGVAGNYVYFGPYFNNRQQQYNVVNTLSISTGSHALKFGFDYRRLPVVQDAPNYQRYVFFDNAAAVVGDNVSSALVGRSDVKPAPLFNNYAAYAQDTWRVTRALTLTYGARYDVNPVPAFPKGNPPYTLLGLENPLTATLAPSGARLYETSYKDFAPRIGVAYQLNNRSGKETTLRGGFGVFYDLGYSYIGNSLNISNLPYGGYAFGGGISLSDPFLSRLPSLNDLSPFYGVTVYEPGYKSPYSLQFNVAIEQSFSPQDAITITYAGSHGRMLERLESRQVPNGVGGLANITRLDIIRNAATSYYDALQLQYQRRLSRGLQALVSYSFAKSLDNAPATDTSLYAPLAPSDRYDPRRDRGPSDFDVRHTLSATVSYNLPSPFSGGVGRAILGGFAVDSIFRARSSTPVNVVAGDDPFGFGLRAVYRPDLVPGAPLYLKGDDIPGGRRINPAAFVAPEGGKQGTLGRNALQGFPLSQLDLSLRRQFKLTERINLQFKADAFNIFNHPNFANPINSLYSGGVANINDPNFGVSTQMLGRGFANTGGGVSPLYQIGGARSLQLSLKLSF